MKITLDFDKKQAVIDGTQDEAAALLKLVKDIAPSLTEIRVVMDGAGGASRDGGGTPTPLPSRTPTLRDFAKSLTPTIQSDRIAVVAYYQVKILKQDGFSPKDMSNLLALCGWPKPDVPARAMYDAKERRGYVEQKGYGRWTITTEGENFVLSLMESKGMNG